MVKIMEWSEFQALWQQYDARIAENTRINKEVLKRMLRAKPERRVNWIRLQTGAGVLLMPIVLFFLFTLLPFKFNQGFALYLGIFLYGGGCLLAYCWSIKYFLLLRNINFTNSVTATRKNLKQLEKFQTKIIKIGYFLMPFAIIGVFLMFDMPLFTKRSLVPLSLCFVVMVGSMYYKFRWKNRWFRKLNFELDEIEQLEKE
jgi:hypothetical protein